ncbi:MAG: molybdopterin molybdotransferase MoeA, partial [Desulfuromonadales bacterium]|nr:molybdopterin molybdotransferase MoeA [Desulfuromonadales bacterium]
MAETFAAARALIQENICSLEPETVDLLNLVGRVVAEEICAPWDLPRWDNSEMDGFAVKSADCHTFAKLKVVGYIPAGAAAEGISVATGTAVRIMTGAPIPIGCDAIVPIENTESDKESVTIKRPVQIGDYIRFCGSDINAGEVMISPGTILRPAEVNLLASFSRLEVLVHRCPRVAILSTGDELVAPGEAVGPGQIIDSNGYSLAAAVSEVGAIPILLGIARDNIGSLTEKIAQGLKADVFITSAGVSMGDLDLVCKVLDGAGVKQLFWKVDIKPGRPTAFGLKDGCAVFSLPGNPVSSMIAFEELVRPALLKMMGQTKVFKPFVKAALTKPLYNETGRVRFLRVRVVESSTGLIAESAGDQNTGILSTMIRANAIAVLPADRTEFVAGEEVDIHL